MYINNFTPKIPYPTSKNAKSIPKNKLQTSFTTTPTVSNLNNVSLRKSLVPSENIRFVTGQFRKFTRCQSKAAKEIPLKVKFRKKIREIIANSVNATKNSSRQTLGLEYDMVIHHIKAGDEMHFDSTIKVLQELNHLNPKEIRRSYNYKKLIIDQEK
eukprot:CAMPEP_0168330518 /NCGR_PEP_ID=MMETSP0213-20121227/7788_1 /TAXON_ID=151035 /ORGANISM="Euplotes harpa, Strain FSP1.4" /LENGTH=156 /DNA_ID=CAMNT_0008334123 /DNA_START=352 /DNA_END=822 /DNA_ORIENTATION=+